MQIALAWVLIIFGGGLYLAQIISSINFPLAQRLGIQEKAETSDMLLQRSERYTAYWDLLMLLWLPAAGILMLIDHPWWPIMSLMGGSIYLDTSGREAVKNLSFRHAGFKAGTANEQRIFFASYIIMAVIAITVIAFSLIALFSYCD